MAWQLSPGATLLRKDIHAAYGGSGQGGINPSARTPNVLIFSDPARGHRHGYLEDGWRDDQMFHYTGEGQEGDQRIANGNKAIAQHVADGRALRVFMGSAGTVQYEGEFALADDRPLYWADAPESVEAPSRGDVIRQVVVFRLQPLDSAAPAAANPLDGLPTAVVTNVPIEQQNTETTFVNPNAEPYEIDRREQRLVLAYEAYLTAQQSEVSRHLLRPPGEAKPLFNDLYDHTRQNLVEAKGVGTRAAVRMAIGQLADYGRFVPKGSARAVLLPTRPRPDLEELLSSQGIAAVWQTNTGFADNAGGRFTSPPPGR